MTQQPPKPHIGVNVWQAFRAYRAAMYAQVATSGFPDITETDSDVLVWVGSKGTTITAIAAARGVSKQAVQNQVKGLIDRGYLEAVVDPDDNRARRLTRTAKGRDLASTMEGIKQSLDDAVTAQIGAENYRVLQDLLEQMERAVSGSPS